MLKDFVINEGFNIMKSESGISWEGGGGSQKQLRKPWGPFDVDGFTFKKTKNVRKRKGKEEAKKREGSRKL